jgi:hypothetical protein
MSAKVILHMPERMIEGFAKGKPPLLYGRIRQTLVARGVEPVFAPLVPHEAAPAIRDGNLHLIENGRVQAQGWLNAATAYLEGFFHVDPQGIQAASRIAALPYDPLAIPEPEAEAYLAMLHARFTARRHSRYKQTRVATELPQGAIAVFLQGPAPIWQGQSYCSFQDMLRTVARHAEGRPILVKPHPLKPEHGAEIIQKLILEGHPLQQTEANVHDILAACALSVSINSATAIEGFLHEKPAILFGKSDFHALVETVRDPADYPAALHRALTTPRDYARALTWYFGRNCLDIEAASFDARLLAIFAEAGFDAPRLGLS